MNRSVGPRNPADIYHGMSPSAYMRQARPEQYSDSQERSAFKLDASALEQRLDTLTARNQTHDFEIFCRKLCGRVICPNLKPATGPEGGGDRKADTETNATANEITKPEERRVGKEWVRTCRSRWWP